MEPSPPVERAKAKSNAIMDFAASGMRLWGNFLLCQGDWRKLRNKSGF